MSALTWIQTVSDGIPEGYILKKAADNKSMRLDQGPTHDLTRYPYMSDYKIQIFMKKSIMQHY